MAKVENLRAQLTSVQREILNAIWDYYRRRTEWIPLRVLHHRSSKEDVRAALQQLGGSIAYEVREGGKERYGLTFLGLLLTDQGEEVEQLLARYLHYLRERFQVDPEIEAVKSREMETALHLSGEQSRLLSQVVRLSHLYGNGGSFGEQEWSVGVPYNIEDLQAVEDFPAFVQAIASKEFDPAVPVGDRERIQYLLSRSHQEALRDEFVFVREPVLQQQLREDWQEAQKAHEVGARKSCVIMCGGILEGALLSVLTADESRAKETYGRLKKRAAPAFTRWNLGELVDVAEDLGALGKASVHLCNAVREYRNLIHPGRQVQAKLGVTKEVADIAINVVQLCLRELATRVG